jgi:hypothetical protein
VGADTGADPLTHRSNSKLPHTALDAGRIPARLQMDANDRYGQPVVTISSATRGAATGAAAPRSR